MLPLSDKVLQILSALNREGFSAYAVGGCVRDCLWGIPPADWDICTSALPQQTMAVFEDFPVIETGLRHGTVTVMMEGQPFEITTFRTEGEYSDGRHPDSVTFSNDIVQDLARRDFTINAMAYHPDIGLVDPFGGQEDLGKKLLRCVGNPHRRFAEDALRMLRGLRFAARFGLEIEQACGDALHQCKQLLSNVSAERIFSELCKLLCEKNTEQILWEYSDVLFEILPELALMQGFAQNNPYHLFDVWQHTVKALSSATPDVTIRLALLFHDMGKPTCCTFQKGVGHFYGHPAISETMAAEVLLRLKAPTHLRSRVCKLIKLHDFPLQCSSFAIKQHLNEWGAELFFLLLEVKRGDIQAQNPQFSHRLAELDAIEQLAKELLAQNACISFKQLAVSGKDLLAMGCPEGKQIGKILRFILEQVLADHLVNDHTALIAYIQQNKEKLWKL